MASLAMRGSPSASYLRMVRCLRPKASPACVCVKSHLVRHFLVKLESWLIGFFTIVLKKIEFEPFTIAGSVD